MKVEIKQLDGLVRELSVEVPAETVNARTEQKLKEVRRDASLKGFRKGKAPMNMIKSIYGEQVKIDVAEDLIKSTYPEVVRENTLKVASYPQVTDLKYEDDGSLSYTATVEVFPEIDKVNFDGLTLVGEDIEVKDDEVDDIVEHLRKRSAEVRAVERAVGENDLVTLDIEVTSDPGKVLSTDRFDGSEVDLSNKLTVKEFREALPGLKAGDVKEIEVKYDKEYPDEVFAGAELKYKCTVKAVKERILPELNDAFAKSTGQAETALELRIKIRERLTRQKTDDRNRGFKHQVIEQMAEKNQVPLPNSIVQEYLDNVIENFKKQYGEGDDFNEAEVRKNYQPMAETNLRWNMLLHQLAKQEKIEVLSSDTENLINRVAENYKTTPEKAREALQQSGNIADLRESILEDKVIDFLVSKASVKKPDK
ncbi:MAG: trigger factor [Candidatus Zixiibacteriota bacterium]